MVALISIKSNSSVLPSRENITQTVIILQHSHCTYLWGISITCKIAKMLLHAESVLHLLLTMVNFTGYHLGRVSWFRMQNHCVSFQACIVVLSQGSKGSRKESEECPNPNRIHMIISVSQSSLSTHPKSK